MSEQSSREPGSSYPFSELYSPPVRQGERGKGPPSLEEVRKKGWVRQGERGKAVQVQRKTITRGNGNRRTR